MFLKCSCSYITFILVRGDSTKTADEVTNLHYIQPQLPPRLNSPVTTVATKPRQARNLRQQQSEQEYYNRNRNRSNHRQQSYRRRHFHRDGSGQLVDKEQRRLPPSNFLIQQKTYSTDVPDSCSTESHVLNCRMLSEQKRTRSLGTSHYLLHNFSESECKSTSTHSASTASPTSTAHSSDSSTSTFCSSNTTTTTSFCPQGPEPRGFRGQDTLLPYSIRLKSFRSMPDVARFAGSTVIASGGGINAGGYQLALSCGHKDCRDYYRLQALRSDLQVGRKRPEKMGLEKPALFREREIELTPSTEEDDRQSAHSPSLIGKSDENQLSPLPNPIASDAYSVHGLSDAISVDSSNNGSEAPQSACSEFNQ